MAFASQPEETYEVFLSFRGPETRHTIVSFLYQALEQIGILTFKDNEKLKKGDLISKLLSAIEKSRIAVIIFSLDFASSPWCLKEVTKIMECWKKNKLIVLPVFYYVDPNEVRNGRDRYREAIDRHKKKYGRDSEDVKNWEQALADAGSLYGSQFHVWVVEKDTTIQLESGESDSVKKNFRKGTSIQNGSEFRTEADLVGSIVREIWIRLNPIPLAVTKFPVGLDSRVEDLISKFNLKSPEETLTIGLCSIGGMGKTVLAKALYNSIFNHFDGSAYVDGIKRTAKETTKMVDLQKRLLFQLLHGEKIPLNSDSEGSTLIEKRLGRKRVLLILDGVDHMCQIDCLAGKPHWFKEGSKIIITTTNQDLLKKIDALIHHVLPLEEVDACKLFRMHASRNKKNEREINFGNYVDRAVQYTKRHPLALMVLGCAFAAREEDAWEGILAKFAQSSHKDVDEVLSISYEELVPEERKIFLHIACFFNGWSRRYVEGVLKNCDSSVDTTVRNLIGRSLITDENGTLTLHDLIELMGKKIVDRECLGDAAKRSRLWRLEDVHKVLSGDEGTDAVEAIVLALPKPEKIDICSEAFKKLKNLIFFIMINVETSFQGPLCLPRELRWFEWPECPASSLKFTSRDNLAVLAVRKHLFEEPEEP